MVVGVLYIVHKNSTGSRSRAPCAWWPWFKFHDILPRWSNRSVLLISLRTSSCVIFFLFCFFVHSRGRENREFASRWTWKWWRMGQRAYIRYNVMVIFFLSFNFDGETIKCMRDEYERTVEMVLPFFFFFNVFFFLLMLLPVAVVVVVVRVFLPFRPIVAHSHGWNDSDVRSVAPKKTTQRKFCLLSA